MNTHKFDEAEYGLKERKKNDDNKEKENAKTEIKGNDIKGLQKRIERIERILEI